MVKWPTPEDCPGSKAARSLLLLVIALCGFACSGPQGEQFADVDAITLSDTWHEWVVVGHFGSSGPFTVREVKYCATSQPCSFSHRGQSHTYQKFTGYELTVLRLEGSSGEIAHVVLRSAEMSN